MELKNCPFCEGMPALKEEPCGGWNDGSRWVVECKCGAKVVSCYWQGRDEAVAVWNRRPGQEEAIS